MSAHANHESTRIFLLHCNCRFCRLDRTNQGSLGHDDLLSVPELAMNPLSHHITTMLGTNSGRVTFAAFARTLAVFQRRGSQEKARLLFSLFSDGAADSVTKDSLRCVLQHLVGSEMDEADLCRLCALVIGSAGRLEFDEFRALVSQAPWVDIALESRRI